MTEREKCQLGLLYDTTFSGRDEDNLRCLDLCHEFNQMKPSDLAGREAILRKIMHKVGKNVRAEQNIYISFGYNMEAGDNLFINHNCVFLDPGKITFGDNVFIGPCCGFYTAHHPSEIRQITMCCSDYDPIVKFQYRKVERYEYTLRRLCAR